MHIGAGGNAHEHALFLADAASHGKGLLVGDRDDFVDDIEVEVVGDKAGTGSLNFCGARFHGLASASLGDDGRIFGFDRDGAEGFLRVLMTSETPVMVPPVPTAEIKISTKPSVSDQISSAVVFL